MSRVIFLDIDGVLATLRSHLSHHGRGGVYEEWDDLATAVLRRICSNTDVRLVISSTWRLGVADPTKRTHIMEGALVPQLAKHGLTQWLRMPNWKTPTERLTPRGNEIASYLAANPDITDYRILDDDSDMLPDQMDRLIKTSCHEGITALQIIALYEWAGVDPIARHRGPV